MTAEKTASDNFGFLSQHDPLLAKPCAAEERNLTSRYLNTCILKLRQFGEALAQYVAALLGIDPTLESTQADLRVLLQRKNLVDRSLADMLHMLRHQGNATNISISQCRALERPGPSVEDQSETMNRVERLFAFADRLEERLFIGSKQVERLTPAILVKTFRGEIVPQDPNDESAAALLERIRTQSNTAQALPGTSTRGRPRKRLS